MNQNDSGRRYFIPQIVTVSGDLVPLEEIKEQILANFTTSQSKPSGSKSPKSSAQGWTAVRPVSLPFSTIFHRFPCQIGIQELRAAAQLRASQAVHPPGDRENTGELDAQRRAWHIYI